MAGTGTVNGYYAVGGLVGGNLGTITNANSAATISAAASGPAINGTGIGGLVGVNDGTMTNDDATGAVNAAAGDFAVGGLVGVNESTMTNDYATGTVTGATITPDMFLRIANG